MKQFKINKGIQKEIRYLGLNSEFALKYLLSVAFFYLLSFSLIGMTKQTFLVYIIAIFAIYYPFKKMDLNNKEYNLKKKKANKFKPSNFSRQ